jgi:hypothetical protein
MFLGVVGLRLGEIFLGVLHELSHGFLATEAIGLALNLRIDGAVGLYVLTEGETHCAHVAVLAGHGQGWLILFGSAPFTPPIAKCHFKVEAISNFRIAVYHSGSARWPFPAEGQIE